MQGQGTGRFQQQLGRPVHAQVICKGNQLMEMPRYTFPVTLIPGGCPQFLDFGVDFAALDPKLLRFSRSFREERRAGSTGDGRENFLLHCIAENEHGQWVDQITGALSPPSSYEIDSRKCLDAYFDQWVPLPFLRIRDMKRADGTPMFELGPSNWARCRLVKPRDGSQRVRIILVFDTTVEEPPAGDEHYFALSPGDVAANAVFSLAWHVRDNTWFLNAPWVDRWLFALHEDLLSKKRRPGSDSGYIMEYLANYLTFLDLIRRLIPDTRMRVINPDRDTPVDVDLILDIGNARTTGILVETPPQRVTNLNNSYLLQIRDLSEPENIYTEPFATRIEFSEASFGDDAYSKLSGRRTPAFPWASCVRMGPEAARLSTRAKCAEGTTGMSSPKRYLWDERIWKPTWRFNTDGSYEPMVTRGSFAKQVNHMGTPLSCFDDPAIAKNPLYKNQEREIAFESQFTRSSIMMFLIGEVIMHTLVTINSPAQRGRRELSDLPRRLRRIVFTVPSGMPIAEQRIYRRWVSFAVRTVWQALGWGNWYVPPHSREVPGREDYRRNPETRCSWDEASCTQIVYLYNEIIHKFNGDAHQFFRLMGKERNGYGPYHSLRVASIDVGGGTTDLSVATYTLDNDESSTARVRPHLELRDGFNLAGDDILRGVIGDCVLTAIAKAAAEQGVSSTRHLLGECFGRDVLDNSQENRNLRAQFTRQVAAPVGLALLSAYEKTDPLRTPSMTFVIRDFFDIPVDPWADEEEDGLALASSLPFSKAPPPSQSVVDYVENAVRKSAPGSAFSLLDVQVTMSPAVVENTIYTTLQRILADLCEVVYLYNCDVLLLSGRPSKLHGVIGAILSRLPVPSDRLIPMCEYRVGRWYPFVDHLGMITDPKTTVSMGAILCALAEGHLEGFSFAVKSLALASTARFIGEMDTNGQLTTPKVWFDVNVDSNKEQELEKDIQFTGPLSVGFRQFPVERWPTTRFYLIDFTTEEDRRMASGGRLPYTIKLRFLQRGVEDGTARGEQDEGELSIVSIVDSQGNEPRGGRKAVEVRLQTLPLDEGYWLDTGVLVSS
ncbi:virulence factor SrfB [Desulfovibrio sp. OttesenSCG-928-A18]|nr:virulence factor SrfB [Desulfovibrio sp. OttesenSCG-928-A18]